jgi:hypothetical protein
MIIVGRRAQAVPLQRAWQGPALQAFKDLPKQLRRPGDSAIPCLFVGFSVLLLHTSRLS